MLLALLLLAITGSAVATITPSCNCGVTQASDDSGWGTKYVMPGSYLAPDCDHATATCSAKVDCSYVYPINNTVCGTEPLIFILLTTNDKISTTAFTDSTVGIVPVDRYRAYNCTGGVSSLSLDEDSAGVNLTYYYFESGARDDIDTYNPPYLSSDGTTPCWYNITVDFCNDTHWLDVGEFDATAKAAILLHWNTRGHVKRFDPRDDCHLTPTIWDPNTSCADARSGCFIANTTAGGHLGTVCSQNGYCVATPVNGTSGFPYQCACKTTPSNAQSPWEPLWMGAACEYSREACFPESETLNKICNQFGTCEVAPDDCTCNYASFNSSCGCSTSSCAFPGECSGIADFKTAVCQCDPTHKDSAGNSGTACETSVCKQADCLCTGEEDCPCSGTEPCGNFLAAGFGSAVFGQCVAIVPYSTGYCNCTEGYIGTACQYEAAANGHCPKGDGTGNNTAVCWGRGSPYLVGEECGADVEAPRGSGTCTGGTCACNCTATTPSGLAYDPLTNCRYPVCNNSLIADPSHGTCVNGNWVCKSKWTNSSNAEVMCDIDLCNLGGNVNSSINTGSDCQCNANYTFNILPNQLQQVNPQRLCFDDCPKYGSIYCATAKWPDNTVIGQQGYTPENPQTNYTATRSCTCTCSPRDGYPLREDPTLGCVPACSGSYTNQHGTYVGPNCTCNALYTGPYCETAIGSCSSNPCQNGGICHNTDAEVWVCECLTGFNGTTCQNNLDECLSSPCLFGGTCVDGINTYTCNCPANFTGDNCEIIGYNDCLSEPCQNGATCIDGVLSYSCSCVAGYSGSTCQTQIDYCASEPCRNGGTCTTLVNDYNCTCLAGFYQPVCDETNNCESNPCLHGGTCTNEIDAFSCSCAEGYSGDTCQVVGENECASAPCQNGGTCVDDLLTYNCTCPEGFSGTTCGSTPCSSSPCQNGGTCTNDGDAYSCACSVKWTGSECQTEAKSETGSSGLSTQKFATYVSLGVVGVVGLGLLGAAAGGFIGGGAAAAGATATAAAATTTATAAPTSVQMTAVPIVSRGSEVRPLLHRNNPFM